MPVFIVQQAKNPDLDATLLARGTQIGNDNSMIKHAILLRLMRPWAA